MRVRVDLNLFVCPFRGGAANLGKPELEKVMQRRRQDADGKAGSIKPNRSPSPNPQGGGNDELTAQLRRRTQLMEDVSGLYR